MAFVRVAPFAPWWFTAALVASACSSNPGGPTASSSGATTGSASGAGGSGGGGGTGGTGTSTGTSTSTSSGTGGGGGAVESAHTRYPAQARHSPMSAAVVARLKSAIAASPGRHDVFAKVGDSITVSPQFLGCFVGSSVDLADSAALEPTRAFFAATLGRGHGDLVRPHDPRGHRRLVRGRRQRGEPDAHPAGGDRHPAGLRGDHVRHQRQLRRRPADLREEPPRRHRRAARARRRPHHEHHAPAGRRRRRQRPGPRDGHHHPCRRPAPPAAAHGLPRDARRACPRTASPATASTRRRTSRAPTTRAGSPTPRSSSA